MLSEALLIFVGSYPPSKTNNTRLDAYFCAIVDKISTNKVGLLLKSLNMYITIER